jgi:hypothetical protein
MDEIKLLKQIAKLQTLDGSPGRTLRSGRKGFLMLGCVSAFYLVYLHDHSALTIKWAIGLAFISGSCIAVGVYQTIAMRQWPLWAKYIDFESIHRRLKELET